MISCIIVYIYAQYIIPRPSTFYPWGWPLASPNMETAAWPLVTHCAIRIFCFINISILVESQNVSVNLNYWQSAISNVMICHRMMMDICIYISIYLLYPILQFISYLWYLWCVYLFSIPQYETHGLEYILTFPLGWSLLAMVISMYYMYEPLEHITNYVYIYII